MSPDTRILILALGINDGLRGVPVPTVERNLSTIIERAQSRKVTVLVCQMEASPVHGFGYTVEFHRLFTRLAARYDLAVVPFFLYGVAGDPALNLRDRIHPNAAGHKLIAETVWTHLEPLLRSTDWKESAGSLRIPLPQQMRILIVEDEVKVARALSHGLERELYEVVIASNGEEGFYRANSETFDLIILDVMLPGRDGFEILTALRKAGAVAPILVLTAKDAIEDRVTGLDAGADDYLVKPFAFPELLARIRVLLRRARPDVLRLRLADLELDRVTRRVTRAGQVLDLRAREFELLEYLLRHQEQLVSREMLARDVWKALHRGTPLDNVIDVHIARVRRKVDSEFSVKLIHTIRGVGFVLREGEP